MGTSGDEIYADYRLASAVRQELGFVGRFVEIADSLADLTAAGRHVLELVNLSTGVREAVQPPPTPASPEPVQTVADPRFPKPSAASRTPTKPPDRLVIPRGQRGSAPADPATQMPGSNEELLDKPNRW